MWRINQLCVNTDFENHVEIMSSIWGLRQRPLSLSLRLPADLQLQSPIPMTFSWPRPVIFSSLDGNQI